MYKLIGELNDALQKRDQDQIIDVLKQEPELAVETNRNGQNIYWIATSFGMNNLLRFMQEDERVQQYCKFDIEDFAGRNVFEFIKPYRADDTRAVLEEYFHQFDCEDELEDAMSEALNSNESTRIIELLKERPSLVRFENRMKQDVFWHAAKAGLMDVLQHLCEDKECRKYARFPEHDMAGIHPRQIAENNGHEDAVKYIRDEVELRGFLGKGIDFPSRNLGLAFCFAHKKYRNLRLSVQDRLREARYGIEELFDKPPPKSSRPPKEYDLDHPDHFRNDWDHE